MSGLMSRLMSGFMPGLAPGFGRGGGAGGAVVCRGVVHDPQADALFQGHFGPDGGQKPRGGGGGKLDMGFVIQHPDRADGGLGDATGGAEHRQEPARLGILAAANGQGDPDRGAKLGPVAAGFALAIGAAGVAQFLGR